MVRKAVLLDLVFNFCFVLLGRCFRIAMCNGCDVYLVLCACIIYTYKNKHAYIQFIYYFSLCIKVYIDICILTAMIQKSFMVSSYLAEQWQYLPPPKDNRCRHGGVFVFFAGVRLDSSCLIHVSF